jgi:hypothetical protein
MAMRLVRSRVSIKDLTYSGTGGQEHWSWRLAPVRGRHAGQMGATSLAEAAALGAIATQSNAASGPQQRLTHRGWPHEHVVTLHQQDPGTLEQCGLLPHCINPAPECVCAWA